MHSIESLSFDKKFYPTQIEYNFNKKIKHPLNAFDFLVCSSWLFVCKASVGNSFTTTAGLDSSLWCRFFFTSKLKLPQNLIHVIDGVLWTPSTSTFNLQFNLNEMLSEERLLIFTNLTTTTFKQSSISFIFNSVCWLERELSEFSGLIIYNLNDTRRLLTDYIQEKDNVETHCGNDRQFDNLIYDISFSF